jgi:hypothetical protein
MVKLKYLLRSILRSKGLDIVKISHKTGTDPALTEYIIDQLFTIGQGSVPAYSVPVSDITWDNGFSLHPDGWNPYLQTAVEYLSGKVQNYQDSSLNTFYNTFTPETAGAYLSAGLSSSGTLSEIPAHSYILPWSVLSPEERLKSRQKQNREEEQLSSSLFGKTRNISGINKMGPVSPDKGQLEFKRITSLVDSIKKQGYNRSLAMDVEAVALQHKGKIIFVISSGFHRSAVLAALGHQSIPILLKPRLIVTMDLILQGAAVRNAYWTKADLEIYINYLFTEKGKDRARSLGLL